jgi:hypothetical protein
MTWSTVSDPPWPQSQQTVEAASTWARTLRHGRPWRPSLGMATSGLCGNRTAGSGVLLAQRLSEKGQRMPANDKPYCAYDPEHPSDQITVVKDVKAHTVPKRFRTLQGEVVRQVPVPRIVTLSCGTCGRVTEWQAPNDWRPGS